MSLLEAAPQADSQKWDETKFAEAGKLLELEYANIHAQLEEIERKLQEVIEKRIFISKQYANVAHDLRAAKLPKKNSKTTVKETKKIGTDHVTLKPIKSVDN